MTTEPNQAPENPNYDIHRIDFLSDPALAGAPEHCIGMGVLTLTEGGTGRRCTALVNHHYALMLLEARRDLDGMIAGAAQAVRWLRSGWPEEWGTPGLNPTWLHIPAAGTDA